MKIFIDIGHPAQVHYFRNFIKIMKEKGHEFFITARDKEVTHQLLNYYNIEFHSRGKGRNGYLGKSFYILEADYKLFKYAKIFKPDLFLSFGSPYAAHASKFFNRPHIAFDDTDHAKFEHMMYVPFTDEIHTPEYYCKDFGKKHFRFNGIMEISYLHPKYFLRQISDEKLRSKLVIIRLISWEASHDFGHFRESLTNFVNFLNEISKKFDIIISSEKDVPSELKKYYQKIRPETLHNLLNKASIYIGEGSTIANECAILGTPNILINPISKNIGVHQFLHSKGLQEFYDNFNIALPRIYNLLENIDDEKNKIKERATSFLNETIDVTEYLINTIERVFNNLRK